MIQIQRIDLLFGPSEFQQCSLSDWSKTTCVVFDILRFTSTATQALAVGAAGVIPAKSIPDALAIHARYPGSLLAGERNGARIGACLTGGVDFDLGNSPREFTSESVAGKVVISTTTNGTRALNYCKGAPQVMAASFLNRRASVQWILEHPTRRVCLVCAGTHEESSYEDMLGAGAIADALLKELVPEQESVSYSDSVLACQLLYQQAEREGLEMCFQRSRNGRSLSAIPALAADVPSAAQEDLYSFAVLLDGEGVLRASQ